jgi:hypothetical protein
LESATIIISRDCVRARQALYSLNGTRSITPHLSQFSAALASLFTSAFTLLMHRIAGTRNTSVAESQQQANQRRLTIAIGIITLSSVILFIAPMIINAITIWFNIAFPGRNYITQMSQLQAILNTVIYIVRQSEIRSAMLRVLKCRIKGHSRKRSEANYRS